MSRRLLPVLLLASLVAACTSAPPPAAPTPLPETRTELTLDYRVLLRQPDRSYVVLTEERVPSGSGLRFEVQVDTSGFLYILILGSSGSWKVLFPVDPGTGDPLVLSGSEPSVVPSGGYYHLDTTAGDETFYLVFSPFPVKEIERLLLEDPWDEAALHTAVRHLQEVQVTFGTVSTTGEGGRRRVHLKSSEPVPVLVAPIELEHTP